MSVHQGIRGRLRSRHLIATLAMSLGCGGAATAVDAPPATVAEVVVAPNASTIVVGAALPLQATVRDASGAPVSDAAVVWSVKDSSIAAVSAAGVVTARAVGSTQVAASANGKSGVADITVQRPPVAAVTVQPHGATIQRGATVQLAATAADAAGVALTDRAVTWSSADNGVAVVSTSGLVTGVAVGTARISASSEGKADTISIAVVPVPVGSVTVQPATVSLVAGQSTTLTATVKDENGAVVTDRAVAWRSSNALVATVTQSGAVKAVGAGSTTISATSEGSSGNAVVTVAATPVATVSLLPTTATLQRGKTVTLVPTLKDASGATLSGRTVTWSSSDSSVATVSSSGVVTAVAIGSATITATSEGKSAGAKVTVAPGPVDQVRVTPVSTNLKSGKSVQLSAVAVDANGDPISGATFTWRSSDNGIATVTSNGLVRADDPGSATITATYQGKAGSASVHVTR